MTLNSFFNVSYIIYSPVRSCAKSFHHTLAYDAHALLLLLFHLMYISTLSQSETVSASATTVSI